MVEHQVDEAKPRKRSRGIGLAGLIVAFVGLAGAIFVPLAFEVKQPPPKHLSDVLAETAGKIKDRLTRKEPPSPPPRQISWPIVALMGVSAVGFVGAALGT